MDLRTLFKEKSNQSISRQWFSSYTNTELEILAPVNGSRQKVEVFILPKYCHALAFQQSERTHKHILKSTHTY